MFQTDDSVLVTLSDMENEKDVPNTPEIKEIAAHKKNPDLGMKKIFFYKEILIEQEDARTFKHNEEVNIPGKRLLI